MMGERLPPGTTSEESARLDRGGPGTPGWVKVCAIIASIFLVVFVVLHLTGKQLGGHMSGHRMDSSGASSP